ncbi:MAG: pyridoxal 5'-phosphate synthase glutaminase subunit PdxT [Acidobacteria bacterium]|nr:pyridoxal 5'-phosphate synthase glutaminase subunit PdxT [Acidobacteriota bacterium]
MKKVEKEIASKAVIGILAVQGDFQAHRNALAHLGVPSRLVKKPSDLEGVCGLILPGGESTTFLKFLEEEGLLEPIRQFAETHPVFGTCAGAILMAAKVENPSQPSLGLVHMTVRRNAYGRQLASSIQTAEPEPELQIGPEAGAPLEAVLIRAPLILEVGPEVKTLARLEGKPILVRQGRLLASTFHPELTNDTRVHRYFCRMVSDNSLQKKQ